MDRLAAVKIVQDTFENPFDKGQYINLSKNLFKILDTSGNFIWAGNRLPNAGAFQPYIDSIERIGKTSFHEKSEDEIDILIVNLKTETSLERARTRQRNFVARYLEDKQRTAALVAFVPPDPTNWRFSLVRMDYNIAQSPSGRVKLEKELTPARRYSFLVGENESSHTAQGQLLPILRDDERKPLLSDFEKAFNIEVVTKEFFTKYRVLFNDVNESLEGILKNNAKAREDFAAKNIDPVNFSKKLLGQIVFLYFLQKKGWFGVGRDDIWGTGPKDFLRRLFERKISPYGNFFNDILEPLFYEALSVERTDDFYSRFNCRIPFLNGGLFDPINNYDWVHIDIMLHNELFSNNKETKEGDTGTGILDVFDRYNFTVKEDEPLDKEVAVDPEMLGKVFENLLEVKDRKSKGTYYTPREIVHYMCQESLINYLDTALNTGDVALVTEKPTNLKLFGAPAFQQQALKTPGNTNRVLREDIEAFVRMGELVIEHDTTALQNLDRIEQGIQKTTKYQLKLRSISDNAALIDDALANIRVCDPAIGSGAFPVGLMTEIVRARNTLTTYLLDKTGRTNYHFKRHAIQNCLYGVDIDPGAVEIAKLRLWLSLVVDEEDIKQIQPLPNLDYKIVCGNSLLGVERNMFNNELFHKIENLKPLYFSETNARKKQEFREQIDKLIKNLTNNKETFDFEVYFSEVFHEKGGFDVVIANPPYDVLNITEGHKISRYDLSVLRAMPIYSIALGGKLNLFRLFLARAFSLLNELGIVTYIIPYSFMCDISAKPIREFVLKEKQICFIDAFPERDNPNKRLFEMVKMSTCILCVKNKHEQRPFPVRTYRSREMSKDAPVVYLDLDTIYSVDSNLLSIPLMDNSNIQIVRKITGKGYPKIGQIGNCYQGEVNLTFHKKFLRKTSTDTMLLIKGAGIQRYFLTPKMSQGEVEFVDAISYTKKNTGPRSHHHKKVRIVMQGISGVNEKIRLKATIINPGIFCAHSVNYILLNNDNYNLKYVLGILNSKLINWYFKLFSTNSNVNSYEINGIPITFKDQASLINLVENIFAITKDEDYLYNADKQSKVKELEKQIDLMVYELYGLTTEERAVVEEFSKNK